MKYKKETVTNWEMYLTIEGNSEKMHMNVWDIPSHSIDMWGIFPNIDRDIKHVIDIIGPKWALLIVTHLARHTLRFGELIKAIPEINPKTLAQRLNELEEYGIVIRKQYETIPPKVEYSLTEKGKMLGPICFSMGEWARRYSNKK